jgi:archaellum biogenesis ATPase FlaH
MILQAPVSRLLRLVIEKQDLSFLSQEGILEEDFQPKNANVAFNWLKDYKHKWGQLPKLSTLKDELDLDLPEEVESDEFVLRSFKDYSKGQKLKSIIEAATSCLEVKDVDGAISKIKEVNDLDSASVFGRSFRGTAEDRYNRYLEGKIKQGGIDTPWPALTDQVIGYLPETLTTWIAMSNVGKSYASVIHANFFLDQGLRVALVTMEDSVELIENRIDSCRFKVSNRGLNNHQLYLRDDVKWRAGLVEGIPGNGDIFLYDQTVVKTVSDLESVIDTCKAEVLIVDAAYRLQCPGIEMGWKTSEKVVDQLQKLMHDKHIPIIITIQQDPEQMKKKTKHERLYSTRGGRSWGIGSNLVIEMYTDEEMRLQKILKLSILKNKLHTGDRPDATGEVVINWDLSKMDFSELDPKELVEGIEW